MHTTISIAGYFKNLLESNEPENRPNRKLTAVSHVTGAPRAHTHTHTQLKHCTFPKLQFFAKYPSNHRVNKHGTCSNAWLAHKKTVEFERATVSLFANSVNLLWIWSKFAEKIFRKSASSSENWILVVCHATTLCILSYKIAIRNV